MKLTLNIKRHVKWRFKNVTEIPVNAKKCGLLRNSIGEKDRIIFGCQWSICGIYQLCLIFTRLRKLTKNLQISSDRQNDYFPINMSPLIPWKVWYYVEEQKKQVTHSLSVFSTEKEPCQSWARCCSLLQPADVWGVVRAVLETAGGAACCQAARLPSRRVHLHWPGQDVVWQRHCTEGYHTRQKYSYTIHLLSYCRQLQEFI